MDLFERRGLPVLKIVKRILSRPILCCVSLARSGVCPPDIRGTRRPVPNQAAPARVTTVLSEVWPRRTRTEVGSCKHRNRTCAGWRLGDGRGFRAGRLRYAGRPASWLRSPGHEGLSGAGDIAQKVG